MALWRSSRCCAGIAFQWIQARKHKRSRPPNQCQTGMIHKHNLFNYGFFPPNCSGVLKIVQLSLPTTTRGHCMCSPGTLLMSFDLWAEIVWVFIPGQCIVHRWGRGSRIHPPQQRSRPHSGCRGRRSIRDSIRIRIWKFEKKWMGWTFHTRRLNWSSSNKIFRSRKNRIESFIWLTRINCVAVV